MKKNDNDLLDIIQAEITRLREANEKLKAELADVYSADNEIQGIARKIETENERLHAEIKQLKEALVWCSAPRKEE